MAPAKKSLTSAQQDNLLDALQSRFESNKSRHKGLDWSKGHGAVGRRRRASHSHKIELFSQPRRVPFDYSCTQNSYRKLAAY